VPRTVSPPANASTHSSTAPSRVGKRGVTFYLEPSAFKELRALSVDEETTLQALMIEATNLLFKSRGRAEAAK
jgi:hypothetical protein